MWYLLAFLLQKIFFLHDLSYEIENQYSEASQAIHISAKHTSRDEAYK